MFVECALGLFQLRLGVGCFKQQEGRISICHLCTSTFHSYGVRIVSRRASTNIALLRSAPQLPEAEV